MHSLIRKSYRIIRCSDGLYQSFKNTCLMTPATGVCNVIQQGCLQCLAVRGHFSTKSDASSVASEMENVNVDAICQGDEKLAHKLKVILLEMEVMRQEGKCVPPSSHLKDQHWEELLKLPSLSGRRKYLEFLFKIFKKKEHELEKREEARKIREERLRERPKVETLEEFVSTYDLQHNNIFLRFYDTSINQMYNNRLIQALQFGQKIVVDCGYDKKMTDRENRNCAKQMMLMFADNRVHEDPYDLHFCNVNPSSTLIKALNNYIPIMNEPWFPMNMHSESYLELFPKQNLVYLTPHCREELTEYDHDAVYIIGGIVDKVNNDPLSMAKAKKENVRMAKFPLDRYLQWTGGSGKSLTLNQVISIMLDFKRTGDWSYALRHVPRRKLADISDSSQDNFSAARPRKPKSSWSPSYKVDFDNLQFTPKNTYNQTNKVQYKKANQQNQQRKRLNNVRNIMFDE